MAAPASFGTPSRIQGYDVTNRHYKLVKAGATSSGDVAELYQLRITELHVAASAGGVVAINTNLADAFDFNDGTTSFLKVISTTGSKSVDFGANVNASSGLDVSGAALTSSGGLTLTSSGITMTGLNIGGSGARIGTLYATTVDASGMVISGTTNASFTINSDHAVIDEDSNLVLGGGDGTNKVRGYFKQDSSADLIYVYVEQDTAGNGSYATVAPTFQVGNIGETGDKDPTIKLVGGTGAASKTATIVLDGSAVDLVITCTGGAISAATNFDAEAGLDVTGGALTIGTSGSFSQTVGAFIYNVAASAFAVDAQSMSLDATQASNLTVTGGNLTLSTVTSGTLAVTSAGALNLTGAAASTWAVAGGALIVQTTSQNLTVQTVTSGTLAVTSAGALNLQSGSASTWTLNGVSTIKVDDNTSGVFLIEEDGGADYLKITTTNSSEDISFGNATTNPTFQFLGTGQASFGGNVVITGTLTVNGTTTTVNSTTVTIDDNLLVVNSGPSGSRDGGLLVERFQAAGDAGAGDVVADTAAATGTAQAGGASQITLAAGASGSDDAYNGWWIKITGGTGANQVRLISDYVGTTKVATTATAWTTNPDATSTYSLYDRPFVGIFYDESADEFVVGATASDPGAAAVVISDNVKLHVGALTADDASSVAGGLTLTGSGLTMTGLNIGSTSAEIGNIYVASSKFLYCGDGQEMQFGWNTTGSTGGLCVLSGTPTSSHVTFQGASGAPAVLIDGGAVILTQGKASSGTQNSVSIRAGINNSGGTALTTGSLSAFQVSCVGHASDGAGASYSGVSLPAPTANGSASFYGINFSGAWPIGINFASAATTASIAVPDNSATAFTIKEGSNAYLTLVTTDGSESIDLAKNVNASAGLDVTGGALTIGTSGSFSQTVGAFTYNVAASAFAVDAQSMSLDATQASNLTVTGGNLTLSTVTSGTLAVTSAGALNLTGAAASTWAVSGGALTIRATSQNMTIETATSGDLLVDSSGSLKLETASAATALIYLAKAFASSSQATGSNTAIAQYDLCCIVPSGTAHANDVDGALGAINTSALRSRLLGVAVEAVAAGAEGQMAVAGIVKINKVGSEQWNNGDPIYVSGTAGKATKTAPTGSGTFEAMIGFCVEDEDAASTTARLVRLLPLGLIENP